MTTIVSVIVGTTLELWYTDAMYTTKDICDRFSISGDTVRLWSKAYTAHLSPTANPRKGRQRNFTDEDLTVFALVSEMKGQGAHTEDINASLGTGARGEVPPLDEIIPREHISPTQLRRHLQRTEQALLKATTELQMIQGENRLLRELLKEQSSEKDERIMELMQEVARLRVQLEMTQPSQDE